MILGDSSGVIALIVLRDRGHRRVREFLASNREPMVIPSPAVTEVSYMVEKYAGPGAEARFLRDVGHGRLAVEDPIAADYLRAADLVERYADFPLGTVDALIVAMAERMGVTTLLTLDRRHFGAVRPRHCESFTLVPA